MTVFEEIAEFFEERGYLWNFNGEYRSPTPVDVQHVVDKAAAALYDSKAGSKFEAGRLIVVKNEIGTHDVYVHIGEVK